MVEYEYSFKVKDIQPFIAYCEEKGYIKEKDVEQIRILYKNNNGILARITTNEIEGKVSKYLNFKEENESEQVLKVSQESPMLEIDENNREFVESILKIFDFVKSKELKRKRYVYKKNNVTFEIDNYSKPEMKVVAIEGKKDQVDKIYSEIQDLYQKYKLE